MTDVIVTAFLKEKQIVWADFKWGLWKIYKWKPRYIMMANAYHDQNIYIKYIKNKHALHSKLSSREARENTHFLHYCLTSVNEKNYAP